MRVLVLIYLHPQAFSGEQSRHPFAIGRKHALEGEPINRVPPPVRPRDHFFGIGGLALKSLRKVHVHFPYRSVAVVERDDPRLAKVLGQKRDAGFFLRLSNGAGLERLAGIERFPALIPGLLAQEWIGFVMVRSASDGALVLGRNGTVYLNRNAVEGADPLAHYGANAAAHLRRTDRFTNAPDLLVMSAYDPETGELQWTHYTVPMQKGDPGLDTWKSLDAAQHGGAQTWAPGVYDPETNLYIFGTGNPTPAYTTGTRGEGDNLFTCSLVAVNVDTGKMAWYFQTSPHDMHDYDGVSRVACVARWNNPCGRDDITRFRRDGA